MGKRGPKPQPTHLKLIKGNPGRRPLPEREPEFDVPENPPDPPAFLGPEALQEWHRQVGHLHRSGILTFVDVPALAAFCAAYGLWAQAQQELTDHMKAWRQDPENTGKSGLAMVTPNGAIMQHVLVGIANVAARDMMRFAAELGITPSARTRVQAAPKAKKEDPAAKYFG